MVGFSKKRKSSKLRGTREHGRGKKKGRGAGLRGGRGNAGKHKRVHYAKLGQEFGKFGFKLPIERVNAKVGVNVSDLDAHLPAWVAAGRARKVDGGYTVNLTELGFDKLLGSGQIRSAVKVVVGEATPSAFRRQTGRR